MFLVDGEKTSALRAYFFRTTVIYNLFFSIRDNIHTFANISIIYLYSSSMLKKKKKNISIMACIILIGQTYADANCLTFTLNYNQQIVVLKHT